MAMCSSILNFSTHKNGNLFVLSIPTVFTAMKASGSGASQEQWSRQVKDWVNCQQVPDLKVIVA